MPALLLLALALLPGAAAMGRYVPEGCMETPSGRLIQKFEIDAFCDPTGAGSFAKDVSPCTDDDQALAECYDYCVEVEGPNQRPDGVEYYWADITPHDPTGDYSAGLCASGLAVACYCETECQSGIPSPMGIIAGPCGADEPLVPSDEPARLRVTVPPTPSPVKE